MNYAALKQVDIANGPGARVSLFVSGCTHHCPGCFNSEAWDFSYGDAFDTQAQQEVLDALAPSYITGITILGGEPMEPANQRDLVGFLQQLKTVYPDKTIWMFTGDVLENLLDESSPRHTEATRPILDLVDVLVDGPFVQAKHDITLRFRGSSNQRIIDMKRSLKEGKTVLWEDDPVFAQHAMV